MESRSLAPKEGRWIAKPRKPRWVVPMVLVTVFSSQMPNWINLLSRPGRHSPVLLYLVALFVAAALIILVAVLVRERLARRTRREDLALVDGSFGDQYPVDVTIVANGVRIGSDRGVAWFADGLMGFSGGASSFVLASWDVAPRWGTKGRTKSVGAMPEGAIVLVDAPVPSYVVVSPSRTHWKSYRERLHAFEKESAGADAERFWPPLVPYEEASVPTPVVRK